MGVQQSEVSDRDRNTGALKQVLLPPDGVPAGAAGLLLLLLLLSVERVKVLTGGPSRHRASSTAALGPCVVHVYVQRVPGMSSGWSSP